MEIKFRFWNKSINAMCDWKTAKKHCDRLSLFESDVFIPLQFTGLSDSAGKDIYVGDILEWWTKTPDGYPLDKTPQRHIKVFEIKNLSSGCMLFSGNKYKVIGNIYENKELLVEEVSHVQ